MFEFCKSLCDQIGRSDTVHALVRLCDSLKLFASGQEARLLSNIAVYSLYLPRGAYQSKLITQTENQHHNTRAPYSYSY
jgi:hypothetical protein